MMSFEQFYKLLVIKKASRCERLSIALKQILELPT